MDSFLNYVVFLINEKGQEFYANVDDSYHKHVQAFKNLKLDDVYEYLNYKKTDNVTGYEIASFLGAKGNIVFFHTDVSNYKMNKKVASIIVPEKISESQKKKLTELLDNLDKEGFSYYLNSVKFKNNKSYKLIHNHINLALLKKQVYNIVEDRESEDIECKKMKMKKTI